MKNILVPMAVPLLLLVACTEKLGPGAGAPSVTGMAPSQAQAEPRPTPPPAAESGAAPAGIRTSEDYVAASIVLLDKMTAVFIAAGMDCDKLAAAMGKLIAEERPAATAIKEFEKANPGARQALGQKGEERLRVFKETSRPALEACKDHEGMKKLM